MSKKEMEEQELFHSKASPTKIEHPIHHKKEGDNAALNLQFNSLATRLKILEERYSTSRKKFEVTEQNIIESDRSHEEELRLLSDNILDVKRSMKDLVEKVSLLSDEIKGFVDKNEFTVLERYVEFWNPLDFVTRKEINDFLRKKFHPKKKTVQKEKIISDLQ